MGSVEYSASEAKAPQNHNSLRFSKSSVVSVGMSWSALISPSLFFYEPKLPLYGTTYAHASSL